MVRKEVKEKYGTDNEKTIELQDKVSDKFDKAKKDVADSFGDLKETAMGVGAKIGEKGKEAAEKYYKDITPELNARNRALQEKRMSEQSYENPLAGAAASLALSTAAFLFTPSSSSG